MPDCGKPNFLDEFIVCLKVSNDGTGDAHRELAETIEKAYTSEKERSVSPEIGNLTHTGYLFDNFSLGLCSTTCILRSFCAVGMSVTVVHRGSGSHHLFTGGKLLLDS